MFSALPDLPEDAILRLMALYRDDPRPAKLDLGVGVYRDADGRTPVMGAIKAAEQRLCDTQDTKSYVGLLGAPDFAAAITSLVLGDDMAARTACAATPGGTGALHLAAELVAMAAPGAAVWLPDPTWPNHAGILAHCGRSVRHYRHAAPDGRFDAKGMAEDLRAAAPGDVVLLHGCCHNPTGIDPDADEWAALAAGLAERGLLPLVDLAYLGFGAGLAADAAPLRVLAAHCPEMLIAVSCSKTFGVYRDRVGALLAVAPQPATRERTAAALAHLNRLNFSFPPDHGARAVTLVLEDDGLRVQWHDELEAMRRRIAGLRAALAAGLRQAAQTDQFDGIAAQRGMFSRLGLKPEHIRELRDRHAVYLVGDGRINIAGLTDDVIPTLCRQVADVLHRA
ncbi:aromatic amino acid aminotransferase [Meridianimarinicoccus roseus]|uniref:Aminotransferase n=1 Tax=Meridianimarinicoccus roseus TaxID=2072018 RepID=A0A2V2LFU9_9RHOB|nr:aromatic amino acid transaminase [Meridianimarinicoccus roseus]PWR04518.1 aromatic amino acid aminotransferase [Meridianimarinicoccus roseus]